MSASIFRWAVPLVITGFSLSHSDNSLPGLPAGAMKLGVAYFEPPRSIGTPIEDVARTYTGLGLADRIEGRLRLDTDVSLDRTTRELIRRRLAAAS
ncbi:MAG TPA: hypothetical protein VFD73_20200 [Gemmatimonadales bacterium]|nr:hypothetical protein [Gemmatimonadales bacterium]